MRILRPTTYLVLYPLPFKTTHPQGVRILVAAIRWTQASVPSNRQWPEPLAVLPLSGTERGPGGEAAPRLTYVPWISFSSSSGLCERRNATS